MRVERDRKSAKKEIMAMADEILRRPPCQFNDAKLDLIATIASRMGWFDLFNRITYRHREPVIQKAHWYQD